MHKFQHVYNVVKSTPDPRDYKFARISQPVSLPSFVDLVSKCPPVYNQGDLGSCTGNAIAGAYEFDMMKQGETAFTPSRLFIYYNERLMEGDVGQDNGAQIRDGIKSVSTTGVCNEMLWPYDESKFAVVPSADAYADAAQHKALSYYAVDINLTEVKQALAQGYPIVAGIMVYQSFESDNVAQTGMVPMPDGETCLGGHAVVIVGYNDSINRLIVRNSWGTEWGDKGYFSLPYDYVNPQFMMDLWVIKTIT